MVCLDFVRDFKICWWILMYVVVRWSFVIAVVINFGDPRCPIRGRKT